MKLSLNTDFTKFPRAVSVVRSHDARAVKPAGTATLPHDERHLRRRAIELADGGKVLVDLPEPVMLGHGDRLVLEDGRHVEIIAAEEELYDIRARDAVHLAELAWHIGNRHLAAAIEPDRILILRDHVIKAMLEGLGATVTEIAGAVHAGPRRLFRTWLARHHGHDHHSHEHGHGERDVYGRLPDDPHYGHSHD